jgi:hypothetical protein
MATTDDLLKQLLAAQLAQIALLQSIAANIGTQNRTHLGGTFARKADWSNAKAALDEGAAHITARLNGNAEKAPIGTGDRDADTLPQAFPD